MLNFLYTDGRLTEVTYDLHPKGLTRHDFDFDLATRVAADATALTGDVYTAVDQGTGHWPRFDVVKAPKVGDLVSMTFNGDSYPVGPITAVTASLRKVTAGGKVFWRVRQTSSWKHAGTWFLTPGTKNERNPSF